MRVQDDGHWRFNFQEDPDFVPLEHGRQYDVVVTATDGAGNAKKVPTRFIADGVAPDLTVEEPGAETQDTTPQVSGTGTRVPGDLWFVNIVVLKRDGPGWTGVAHVAPEVGDSGRWTAELTPEVPPGDYVLRLTRLDYAMNATVMERPLRVVPPPPPPEPPPAPPPVGPPLPPPPPTTTVDPPLAGATTLQVATMRTLRATALPRFLKRGAKVPVVTNQAGTATIELLSGAPGARAAATRLVARGRRAIGTSGRGTVTVRATARGRRALKRAKRARLTVRVRFTPASGGAASLDAPLTLKR